MVPVHAALPLEHILLYRGSCPRCRFLSRAVVLLSGNAIRRVPNSAAEAGALYAGRQAAYGKLALLHRGRLHVGRRVFVIAWWVILRCWIARIPGLGET